MKYVILGELRTTLGHPKEIDQFQANFGPQGYKGLLL